METFSIILAGLFFATLQIVVTGHILLFKNDVKSAIGWIGLVWFAPVMGTIIYVLFGINRIRRKAAMLRNGGPDVLDLSQKMESSIENRIPPNLLQLLKLGYNVHPQYFSLANNITPLNNGDEAYPAMCEAISNAKKEVLLASYIFDNDKAGKMFISAIKKAVKNGAKVKVLLDGVGRTRGRKPYITEELKTLNSVQYAIFLPVKAALPFVNLRNHRKILITDGQTAFFGGMNISEGNLLKTKPQNPVRDITFKVEGPVIEQMSLLFLQDWTFACKKSFTPLAFTQKPLPAGQTACRIIPDGPDNDFRKIELINLAALNCAKESVTIVTPYFLPQNTILTALEMASMRGVNVELILPRKSNIFGMDWAMAANFNRLIKKGVKIYLTHAPFDHSKFMIADDIWLFAGSSNWDERSFRLNFESNIEIASKDICQKIRLLAEQKKASAVLIKAKNLPIMQRLRNNALRLFTPYY